MRGDEGHVEDGMDYDVALAYDIRSAAEGSYGFLDCRRFHQL